MTTKRFGAITISALIVSLATTAAAQEINRPTFNDKAQ